MVARGRGRQRQRQRARAYDAALATDPDVIVYRISGAFFFGAAAAVGTALDRLASTRRPT